MKKVSKRNQNLMQLIRRVHGLVENTDIEKHRQSQDYIGAILGNTKEIRYTEVLIEGMYGEWVRLNRAHTKKYVILHCHGGGYSTGSSMYARTLTSKLADASGMDVLCFDYRLAPENPYPAALEDAMKAWNYLMLLGYGAKDVIVTGDSAGGNLALGPYPEAEGGRENSARRTGADVAVDGFNLIPANPLRQRRSCIW